MLELVRMIKRLTTYMINIFIQFRCQNVKTNDAKVYIRLSIVNKYVVLYDSMI